MSQVYQMNICSAMVISSSILINCSEKTENMFCKKHEYKHRLEKPVDCPICFDNISNVTETPLECGHWIHKECIKPTNLHKCSICQLPITKQEINFIFGEGHIESNHYNNGTSIFWNASQEIEDEYEEFHGDDDSDVESENFGSENITQLEEILFERTRENATGSDIINVLFDLQTEIFTITNDLLMNQLESRFIFRESFLTIIPQDEIQNFINTTKQHIDKKLDEILMNYERTQEINVNNLKNEVSAQLMSIEFEQVFMILYNFKRLENEEWMRCSINVVLQIVNNMIVEMFYHLV